jgi:hypothetical protein
MYAHCAHGIKITIKIKIKNESHIAAVAVDFSAMFSKNRSQMAAESWQWSRNSPKIIAKM